MNRLEIATHIMQALVANPDKLSTNTMDELIKAAFETADAMMDYAAEIKPIEIGDVVICADTVADVKDDTRNVDKLHNIAVHSDGHIYRTCALWWRYARRLSDGTIFGPNREVIKAGANSGCG